MPQRAWFIAISFVLFVKTGFSQEFAFTVHKTNEECRKGAANIEITGTQPGDSISIKWSNDGRDTGRVNYLFAGEHFVRINIKYKRDTVFAIKDTVIHFTIEKERCPVSVDKYFSPNDDDYHDRLSIGNLENYPNFALHIYNKWGQQIHSQKKTYTPWDGKWAGIDLPDGTYYYILFYDSNDQSQLLKGDITILR
jgi:gliding motility-associated-like protein